MGISGTFGVEMRTSGAEIYQKDTTFEQKLSRP